MLKSLGLDWLTISGAISDSSIDFFGKIVDLQDQQSAYDKRRPWRLLGYVGESVGPVKMGFRADNRFLTQVSGELANTLTTSVRIPDDSTITRCDYQVTLQQDFPLSYIPKLYKRMLKNYTASGGPKPQLHQSATGDTLYLCRRDSPIFLRLYDKGGEQGGPRGKILRLEVEYKKSKAMPAYDAWQASSERHNLIAGTVKSEFATRGIKLKYPTIDQPTISSESREKLPDRQLAWLRRCVYPVIKDLSGNGYADDAHIALFGDRLNHQKLD